MLLLRCAAYTRAAIEAKKRTGFPSRAKPPQSPIGADHYITLNIQGNCALALIHDLKATKDDEKEGFKMLEAIARTSRRVFGRNHPQTVEALRDVERSRAIIDRRCPKLDLGELPGY